MIKKLFLTCIVLLILICLGVGGLLYWFVVANPGDKISEDNIRSILGRESPVYYNDGTVPLGVFFADAHRQYIDYEGIPETFVNALVAAEDNRFFSHFGFDVLGIARAAIKNIEAGRIVQGGSTLTQQTAKNLFKRKDRSFRAKLEELIYALRLEYHYTKEQILEFYANQFYVSGNGLGLGVASRYYFDKDPDELTLIEAAYIAGSVKRPNYYNPFIKRDEGEVNKALERGKARVAYVLNNMKTLGMISDLQYQQATGQDVPFNKGTFGYALDYVMEMVTDAVASDRIVEALGQFGIDNIATSGIRIITTVDKQIQKNTLYALRKQLSRLDVRMKGYERDEIQAELAGINYRGDQELAPMSFLFGAIRSITGSGDDLTIEVYFGSKIGAGIIDRKGLDMLVTARTKWAKNRWSEPEEEDRVGLLEQLKVGDRVWVSVREIVDESTAYLDLERFPEVQGGAIVIRDGRIVSVAGGVENRFFNRAVYGKRTMGSSFKPFVFNAALQLGWNSADLLQNKRDVFVYQKQAYFPRPDHKIDSELVSMSWAGVRSENLASVWLTAHLSDRLNRVQFEEVAAKLGLAPRMLEGEPEPYRLFRSRIRDRYGIVIDRDVLRKAAYRKALEHIGPDLVFEGLEQEYETIRNLHYGLGFTRFLRQVDRELETLEGNGKRKELELRRSILLNNFLALASLNRELLNFLDAEQVYQAEKIVFDDQAAPEKPVLLYDRLNNSYFFELPSRAPAESGLIDRKKLLDYLAGLEPGAREQFVGNIKLRNLLSVAAFNFVNKQVETQYREMRQLLPYSMDVLTQVEDYRILVGLHYLVEMGRKMGVKSDLEPILSFPLGSNVVSLLEATRVYEALVRGEVTLFTEENGEINNTLAIIDRIESEEGFVLYRPEAETLRTAEPNASLPLGHILENTIKFGTGRYADKNVKFAQKDGDDSSLDELDLSVPLLGKTGTANRYTNASFFGYVPDLNSDGNAMRLDGGYAVGVYVGYDDNKPMRVKSTRITGAAGALPAWTAIVNAIINRKEFSANLDPVDLSFYGLAIKREDLGQANLGVVKEQGGRLVNPTEEVDPLNRYMPSIMTFGDTDAALQFNPARSFSPFWGGAVTQPDEPAPLDP
jgi:membrane peptidoglycan carboxypeptidase